MILKHTILDWLGQDVFVGLDVHKRNWIVAIVTEQTDFKTFTQPPDVELLVSYLPLCLRSRVLWLLDLR